MPGRILSFNLFTDRHEPAIQGIGGRSVPSSELIDRWPTTEATIIGQLTKF
jgi:hypothetical protein